MTNSSSVIMAEAAALALAAEVVSALQIHQVTVLSDNKQLVQFMNGPDLAHPPDWRIKPLTQLISSKVIGTTTQIRRIKRDQNQMADSLARQALRAIGTELHTFQGVCAYEAHDHECPLLVALHNVTINSVMVLIYLGSL
jgi:ribonuclease HI